MLAVCEVLRTCCRCMHPARAFEQNDDRGTRPPAWSRWTRAVDKNSNILDSLRRHSHFARLRLRKAWSQSLGQLRFVSPDGVRMKTMDQQRLDKAIGRRLKTLRTHAGMTLN